HRHTRYQSNEPRLPWATNSNPYPFASPFQMSGAYFELHGSCSKSHFLSREATSVRLLHLALRFPLGLVSDNLDYFHKSGGQAIIAPVRCIHHPRRISLVDSSFRR